MGRWRAWTMRLSLRFTWPTNPSPSQWAASTTTQTRRSQSYQISQRTTVCNKQKLLLTIPTRISRWPKEKTNLRQKDHRVEVRDRTVRHSLSRTYRGSRSSWRKTWFPLQTTLLAASSQQTAPPCATRFTALPKDPLSLRTWATPHPWTHQWKTRHRSLEKMNHSRWWRGIWTNQQAQLSSQTASWSKSLSSAKMSSSKKTTIIKIITKIITSASRWPVIK